MFLRTPYKRGGTERGNTAALWAIGIIKFLIATAGIVLAVISAATGGGKCPAGRPAKPYKWPARKRLRLMAGQVAGECVGADARGYCSGSLLTVFPSWVLNCSEVSLRCIQTHGRRFLLARPPFYGAFSGVICSIPCDLPNGLRHHVIFGPAQVGRVRQDPKSSSQLCCAMSKCR
jgi:hypothetical protein